MMQEEMSKNVQIMMNQPGKPPVPMTMPQIAEMLTQQGECCQSRVSKYMCMKDALQSLKV